MIKRKTGKYVRLSHCLCYQRMPVFTPFVLFFFQIRRMLQNWHSRSRNIYTHYVLIFYYLHFSSKFEERGLWPINNLCNHNCFILSPFQIFIFLILSLQICFLESNQLPIKWAYLTSPLCTRLSLLNTARNKLPLHTASSVELREKLGGFKVLYRLRKQEELILNDQIRLQRWQGMTTRS